MRKFTTAAILVAASLTLAACGAKEEPVAEATTEAAMEAAPAASDAAIASDAAGAMDASDAASEAAM